MDSIKKKLMSVITYSSPPLCIAFSILLTVMSANEQNRLNSSSSSTTIYGNSTASTDLTYIEEQIYSVVPAEYASIIISSLLTALGVIVSIITFIIKKEVSNLKAINVEVVEEKDKLLETVERLTNQQSRAMSLQGMIIGESTSYVNVENQPYGNPTPRDSLNSQITLPSSTSTAYPPPVTVRVKVED